MVSLLAKWFGSSSWVIVEFDLRKLTYLCWAIIDVIYYYILLSSNYNTMRNIRLKQDIALVLALLDKHL